MAVDTLITWSKARNLEGTKFIVFHDRAMENRGRKIEALAQDNCWDLCRLDTVLFTVGL